MSAPGDRTTTRRALPPRRLIVATGIAVAAIWFLLDQATKLLAERTLADGKVDLGLLDLRLVYNPNGAFSIPGFPGLFVGVTVVVVVIVARTLPKSDRVSLAVAYGLVTGGALGNVADRIFRAPGFPSGEVVDFIDLRWWPVFNLADIGIVTGALLVVVLVTLSDREERQRARERDERQSVRPETRTSTLSRQR